ncbi:RIP metalloprotease RseP [Clostridium sp. C105KSO13]|uniref:RIP metalloprotease RseP n=1 Tax=Clostridium sp. C105KSO13 TaxID=1776045 RepID=UPI00074075A8|nr:RIP metalloprotease RseP [Clostridium sp. C105KSO13]CUX30999.1 Regulator of sigma-W protease RasP [Clostridium sp. C105KSO13]
MGIFLAIILFSVIIIFHELGHFTLAKLNGIRVDEFSLGLGPTLIGKEIGGTMFSLKLLPFGGACMMGEDDQDDKSEGSFNSKSVWARISVIAAGPIFNFIMAFVLSVIMVAWIGYDAPVVDGVDKGYSAAEQGMQKGDVITELNGKNIHLWREVSLYNLMHTDADSVEVTYERDGQEHEATLEQRQLEGDSFKRIGIRSSGVNTRPGVIKSLQYGGYTVKYWIDYTFDSLRLLVTGQVGIKQMSGPVGIVDVMDDMYKESAPAGWSVVILNLMNISILLSANLGVMNLLPIPALDGGRLVFLIIEAIRGKRVSPEKEGMVHFAGFALLMVLMAVIMFNDIRRLF